MNINNEEANFVQFVHTAKATFFAKNNEKRLITRLNSILLLFKYEDFTF